MGRLAKNPNVTEVIAQAVTLPSGSVLDRPASPVPGSFRFNITSNKLEIWNGIEWRTVGTEGSVPVTMDTFTANGVDVEFGPVTSVLKTGTEPSIMVFIDSVYQVPYESYVFNNTTNIQFTSIPPRGSTIVVLNGFGSTTM